uniref:Amidase domain-containing protein n=1 Tax=Ditylenchus dipsaci TaxID=166011 RepID=A0A915DBM6_9BILA
MMLLQRNIGKENFEDRYYYYDGFLKATPGCERVVQDTVVKLRGLGHELVHFRVPSVEHAVFRAFPLPAAESGVYFTKVLDNDIVDPYMKEFALLLKIPFFVRSLASYVLPYLSPQASIIFAAYVQTAENVRLAQAECDEYVKQFTNFWREVDIDALICQLFQFLRCLTNMLVDWVFVLSPPLYSMVTAKDDADLCDETKWPTGNNFLLKFMRDASANSEDFTSCASSHSAVSRREMLGRDENSRECLEVNMNYQ